MLLKYFVCLCVECKVIQHKSVQNIYSHINNCKHDSGMKM